MPDIRLKVSAHIDSDVSVLCGVNQGVVALKRGHNRANLYQDNQVKDFSVPNNTVLVVQLNARYMALNANVEMFTSCDGYVWSQLTSDDPEVENVFKEVALRTASNKLYDVYWDVDADKLRLKSADGSISSAKNSRGEIVFDCAKPIIIQNSRGVILIDGAALHFLANGQSTFISGSYLTQGMAYTSKHNPSVLAINDNRILIPYQDMILQVRLDQLAEGGIPVSMVFRSQNTIGGIFDYGCEGAFLLHDSDTRELMQIKYTLGEGNIMPETYER